MAIVQLPPFAKLLRRYRLEAELTQEELAERAGISARAVSDLERGAKLRPHRTTVELLADALNLTTESRAALLSAVPGPNGSRADAANQFQDWLASGSHPVSIETHPVGCPRELKQVLEGLVGLYVDEETRGRQINITVIMFSVP